MTTRYYELTECKHGKFEPHNISDAESGRLVEWEGPYNCPGGQRRELTGVQVRQWHGPITVQPKGRPELGNDLPPGVYAIIPLEDR